MTHLLRFVVEPGGQAVAFQPEVIVAAGYTGRDREAVEAHIHELAALGVEPPLTIPAYYLVPPQLVIQGASIVTTERMTSGEAEVALIMDRDDVFVTVASDHTDRAAERLDVGLSKRACSKIISSQAWRLADLRDHWDSLRLRSWTGNGELDLYQDGSLAVLMRPDDLMAAIPWLDRPDAFMILCGTLPTIGGLKVAGQFRAELHDPVTGRFLRIDYRTQVRRPLRIAEPDDTPATPAESRVRATGSELGIELPTDRVVVLAGTLGKVERALLG